MLDIIMIVNEMNNIKAMRDKDKNGKEDREKGRK